MRIAAILLSVSVSVLMTWVALAAPPQVDPDLPDGTAAAVKQIATLRVPDGLKVELFAAEPKLASPVAIAVDEQNRVFVSEEYRFNRGTEEDRTRPFLLEDDLRIQTTDDRLAMFQKFADRFDGGMNWFSKVSDQVRLVTDTDGDGKADQSSVFATGFNEPLAGLASGVLAHNGDIYFTCIPHLWRLRDTDSDGVADVKEKLLSGFGVNAAFLGHDLHGLVWGPDGKLYFSVGDRGFHVTSKEGVTFHGPRNGAVFRCNPDGSQFEVVHRGLRNPQEIAFDQYGNLFAADNNCDKGDHSRLVHIVEGGDSGWNMAFQSLNVPYLTGPWHAESIWRMPEAAESTDLQPAWIVPPVGPLGAGPSGFAYYPGVGLPSRYADHFFLCNYTGAGGIESFAVKPRGAGFEIIDAQDFLKPLNATDVEFGYDGKMYVSDFVNLDWSGKSMGGRIYTVFDPQFLLRKEAASNRLLVREGFQKLPLGELVHLLAHADMRIRLRAQFELAARGDVAINDLTALAGRKEANIVARLHAVWGLGQIARTRSEFLKPLISLLADENEHVRCQSAKVLGDAKVIDAVPELMTLLKEGDSRGRNFAALAIGKIAAAQPTTPIGARRGDVAFPTSSSLVPIPRSLEQSVLKRGRLNLELIEMLRDNKDADPHLRHAGVMALAWIGDLELVQSFARDRSAAVRRAVLLVQRRTADPRIEQFLDDEDWTIVTEAARAINDVPIEVSQPALARTLDRLTSATGTIGQPVESPSAAAPRIIPLEPLIRRAINANVRLGAPDNLRRVLAVVLNSKHSPRIREEALAALADWTDPPQRDRVTGFWRALSKRDPSIAKSVLDSELSGLLTSVEGPLAAKVVELIARHDLKADDSTIVSWVNDSQRPVGSRVASLHLLVTRKYSSLDDVLKSSMSSNVPALRAAARDVIASSDAAVGLRELRRVVADNAAHTIERQRAFATLASLKNADADALLTEWMQRFADDPSGPSVPFELQVDLLEAATARREVGAINAAMQRRSAALSTKSDDPFAAQRLTLVGGDAEAGRATFIGNGQAQCIRCHKIRGEGGVAGPDLTEVVKRNPQRTREHLLESLIDPNAKVTPGFGSATLVLNSGRIVAGIVKAENAKQITIETPEGRTETVPLADIDERTPPKSTMPPMGRVLSPREMRDLIEFLATLSPS